MLKPHYEIRTVQIGGTRVEVEIDTRRPNGLIWRAVAFAAMMMLVAFPPVGIFLGIISGLLFWVHCASHKASIEARVQETAERAASRYEDSVILATKTLS